MKKVLFILSCVALCPFFAQSQFEFDSSIVVKDLNGNNLKNPWVGGLNSIHISPIDLNYDGIKDLMIYEFESSKVITYLNGGAAGEVDYTYAPEYAQAFDMFIENYVQCIDYNNDGRNDVFVAFNGGMKVYKNVGNKQEGLKFEEYDYLGDNNSLIAKYGTFPSPLYVTRGDAPTISDIDNDGDLDILSFSNFGGSVFYFMNLAADSGNLEKFDYVMATSCWGNFEEDLNSDSITLNVSCKGFNGIPHNKGNKHVGSSLLAFDADGDNDKDLLVGDIQSRRLIFLENGGDPFFADMVSQQAQYPPNNPVNINVFPSPHYLDVNNDGRRDLIVSPNQAGPVENVQSVWYYENVGEDNAPIFSFVKSNFLQDEMIEIGTGAFPVLFDFNYDSLPDLIVGNNNKTRLDTTFFSSLTLFENVDGQQFEFIDSNFADLMNTNLNSTLDEPTLSLATTFGDLDGDGDKDMIAGDYVGKIHFLRNIASPGNSPKFTLVATEYQGIDVGGYAAPFLFDLNRDGRLDLIIGERNGTLFYYENKSTSGDPIFEFISDTLGGVSVVPEGDFQGFSYPFFFYSGDTLKLLCGSQNGRIFLYDGITNNITGKFNLVDTSFGGIDFGMRSTIAGGDWDLDGKLDLFVGNLSGGISAFKTDLSYSAEPDPTSNNPSDYWNIYISPVPSNGLVQVNSNDKNFQTDAFDIRIMDVTGKTLFDKKNTTVKSFDMRSAGKGVYFIELKRAGRTEIRKFIISTNND